MRAWGYRGHLLPHRRMRRNGQRLIDDPATRIRLAKIYSQLDPVRILPVRNFWMSYAGVKQKCHVVQLDLAS